MNRLPGRSDRIDRGQLERILQRAAELQAQERDIGEGLSSDEVLALGKEVGIPAPYLRQAILEERSRGEPPGPAGLADHLVGPGEVSAMRVVPGEPERIEAALLWWMEKQELLVLQRHQPGRLSWERMGGMQAALRRGMATFDAAHARFMLAKAETVTAFLVPLEPGYCQVTLSAVTRENRRGYLAGAVTLTGLGAAGTAVLLTLGALPLIAAAPLPVGLGLGWAVTRGYRPVVERVGLGLERALDHVEGAGIKPGHEPPRPAGLLESIATEVRRALSAHGSRPPDRIRKR